MTKAERKIERLGHANALIKVISEHGRKFFWNAQEGRLARLDIDNRGKLWWTDDYLGTQVFIHRTGFGNRFVGFSHGGTLLALVEDMRDYVVHGRKIARWKIATERLSGDSDIWGYGKEAAAAVRAAAFVLPIMAGEVDT